MRCQVNQTELKKIKIKKKNSSGPLQTLEPGVGGRALEGHRPSQATSDGTLHNSTTVHAANLHQDLHWTSPLACLVEQSPWAGAGTALQRASMEKVPQVHQCSALLHDPPWAQQLFDPGHTMALPKSRCSLNAVFKLLRVRE